MNDRKAGDAIGYIPQSMQKQFLNFSIRRTAAWRQIEAIGKEEIKLFGESDRELNLEEWLYDIDNAKGAIILKRRKTMQEQKLEGVERELIETSNVKVAE